jgi:hypothetical protein
MRITADRPLFSESLWSIRTVLAMEPFVYMSIEPGNEFNWKSTYNYTLMKPPRRFTGMSGLGELAATACSPSIFPRSTV